MLRHQANSSLVAEQKLGRLQPSLCPLQEQSSRLLPREAPVIIAETRTPFLFSPLQELLLAYGEYPAKYRLLVWDFLLRLPHKSEAFQVHTRS